MNRFIKICDINAGRLVNGTDFPIYGVSDPEYPLSNTVIFVKKDLNLFVDFDHSIIVSKEKIDVDKSCIQVISEQPKKAFGDILNKLQKEIDSKEAIFKDGSHINIGAKIGKNSKIGKFCVIEDNVTIGDDCEIGDYTFIGANSWIGNKVRIMHRCSIGIPDADIYIEDGQCLTLPHLAGTIIEDGCVLFEGAHIAAGDTKPTVLCQCSMLGIQANLGHNSFVGKNTLIGAHTCVCGHCEIGNNTYIAPSATIMNRLKLGSNVNVGLGSIVLQDIDDGIRVFGNPAMPIMTRRR